MCQEKRIIDPIIKKRDRLYGLSLIIEANNQNYLVRIIFFVSTKSPALRR